MPDSESLFSETLVAHPRGLGVSSPKTICIDHCGYNFHFSIKVGRGRVIIRTSRGAVGLRWGQPELCQGRVSGSETPITSRVRSFINLSLQWPGGLWISSVWPRDFSKALITVHRMKYVLCSSPVCTHHTYIPRAPLRQRSMRSQEEACVARIWVWLLGAKGGLQSTVNKNPLVLNPAGC